MNACLLTSLLSYAQGLLVWGFGCFGGVFFPKLMFVFSNDKYLVKCCGTMSFVLEILYMNAWN